MKRTQSDRIIDYLATGRALTPLKALHKFGTFRLGARIYDLKQEGHNIVSKRVRKGNVVVSEYRLQ